MDMQGGNEAEGGEDLHGGTGQVGSSVDKSDEPGVIRDPESFGER